MGDGDWIGNVGSIDGIYMTGELLLRGFTVVRVYGPEGRAGGIGPSDDLLGDSIRHKLASPASALQERWGTGASEKEKKN